MTGPAGARRLLLSAAELAVLARASGIALPPGFAVSDVDEPAMRQAAATLVARGVLASDGGGAPDGERDADVDGAADADTEPDSWLGHNRPVAAVAANLAVLAAPTVTVRAEVSAGGRGLRAIYGVHAGLGASLFALPSGGAELSMFPAIALGRELIRAVPAPDELAGNVNRLHAALGGPGPIRPVAGRLPLAALGEYSQGLRVGGRDRARQVAADLGLSAEQAALAGRVAEETCGVLWCVVCGSFADGLAAGQVVWLATDAGWVGLRPDPDGSDRQTVDLVPTVREEIGVWLAPYVGEILEVAGERP